ncbi:bifunctional phosphopantothenoylcysteine decarboxylase/phosphopantothenate synthase [Bifidobacterium saguinibicoloris]|uniref:bifunctional phosphopantothenoylcysteine decarboxylase/phosphopantothenate synthase n=1 Tax=Bifidobacterium saguinibicoloris TaxID=2834433 RepID=UPI001C55D5AA|nr:bifunctional phosphopantothenoylcysteine decarboxylase/phosphopantothenate synthase [Bifidobacterium saguinibicoloris]MBW3081097.1 bifunctional phosphopantothenoylcysteine decarboxylase/phosphopantothenate synthase [Bifidobacterium saguinibicoloris]
MANILLGVTGSIAAFKACHLASDWTKAGHTVRVVETAAAERFVTPLTFTSLTGQTTRTAMFPAIPAVPGDVAANPQSPAAINHVKDASWADLLVVAPASADVIARIACGLADDTLTSTILAYEGPKVLCPAMNVHMYDNPVTQRNLATCRELGWNIVEPGEGTLACGDTGRGRMAEPDVIERAADGLLAHGRDASGETVRNPQTARTQAVPQPGRDAVRRTDVEDAVPAADSGITDGDPVASRPLDGLHVLVTAGPTQEPLDPVRFLTNHSTGKMGYALAESAAALGAHVTLVSGPVALAAPDSPDVDVVHVSTAQDMFDAVAERFASADITVMAAAVGDFRVADVAPEKIKKAGRDSITLTLVANPDILAWAGGRKRDDGSQVLCGFAMETEHLLRNAARKLAEKHCDMLVANNLREEGAGFATDTNVVTVLTPGIADPRTPQVEHWDKMDKTVLAKRIMLRLAALRNS